MADGEAEFRVSWVDRRTDRTYSTTGSTESFSYTATKTVFDSSTL